MIHYRIRSAQYLPLRYSERTAEAGIQPSIGSRGDSYDNALAGTISCLYRAEMIHRRAPWKTREAVERATLEWVSCFNHQRLLEPIGCLPSQKPRQTAVGNSSVPSRWRRDSSQTASRKGRGGSARRAHLYER